MPCSIALKLSSVLAALLLCCSSAQALNFSRPSIHATPTPSPSVKKVTRVFKRLLARVTVYWPREDRWSRRHQSSTGVRLQRNVVAVDPRVIPYRSRIKFPDGICHAIDTGSDVRSRKAARLSGRTLEEKAAVVVDRFFETKQEALAWASNFPPFMALDILPPDNTF